MTVDELKQALETLLDADLGTVRRRKAIAIVPPDIATGDIKGVGCVIQRTPTGERRPSRIDKNGRGLDQWMRKWTVSFINFDNSSSSSKSLAEIKLKVEATYRGQLVGNQGRYFPPTALNKEQCQFEIFDPGLVEV